MKGRWQIQHQPEYNSTVLVWQQDIARIGIGIPQYCDSADVQFIGRMLKAATHEEEDATKDKGT